MSVKKSKSITIWHPDKSIILDCEIGEGSVIHGFVFIGNNVKIGKRCKIQAGAFIPDGVEIEDDCFIGPHAVFTNDKRPPSHGKQWLKTKIKKGAVIGAGAVILPGLTIGKNATVGAGAVLTKNVLDGETWVGNPAKKLK